MAASTTKKVLARRLDGQVVAGYASPGTYLRPDGAEILTRDGQVVLIPYSSLKAVYFVREFDPTPGAGAIEADGAAVQTTVHLTMRCG